MTSLQDLTRPRAIVRPVRPSYRGGTRSECMCEHEFNGVGAFDAHRVGPNGYCQTHDPAHSLKRLRNGKDSYANCPKDQRGCSYQAHPDRRCLTEAEMAASFARERRGFWTIQARQIAEAA
jgi:hypothetical protein